MEVLVIIGLAVLIALVIIQRHNAKPHKWKLEKDSYPESYEGRQRRWLSNRINTDVDDILADRQKNINGHFVFGVKIPDDVVKQGRKAIIDYYNESPQNKGDE